MIYIKKQDYDKAMLMSRVSECWDIKNKLLIDFGLDIPVGLLGTIDNRIEELELDIAGIEYEEAARLDHMTGGEE